MTRIRVDTDGQLDPEVDTITSRGCGSRSSSYTVALVTSQRMLSHLLLTLSLTRFGCTTKVNPFFYIPLCETNFL
jgi:hypothetical protein